MIVGADKVLAGSGWARHKNVAPGAWKGGRVPCCKRKCLAVRESDDDKRHHPSAELRNQLSLTYHKQGVTLSSFDLESIHSMPKAAPKLATASSTLSASISKAPMAVPSSSILTTFSPIENTDSTAQFFDYAGPNAKSTILRNIPEPLCYGMVVLRMLKVFTVHYLSICHRKENSGLRES